MTPKTATRAHNTNPRPKATKAFKFTLRELVALYIQTEGCSCCAREKEHNEYQKELGRLLRIQQYPDKSGYDFYNVAVRALRRPGMNRDK